MKYIGAHVSAAGGVANAPLNAAAIKANAFALFTKNQKRWQAPPLSENDIRAFKENCAAHNFSADQVLPHDSYLINLGNPDPAKYQKSLNAFIDECCRVEQLGLKYLNFHPGSHLKEVSEEVCLKQIAGALDAAVKETEYMIPVIENTAGQGSNVGYRFEHLKAIISQCRDQSRVGVCLDTAHTFAAGYELRNLEDFNKVFKEFDKTVGFKYLKGMHLNDSMVPLGSRKDRHQNLGKGELGKAPFTFIMKDKRFDKMPLILETRDPELWEAEVAWLRENESG